MSEDSISIREWIKNYNAGVYNRPDVSTQIKAGWYDWFCQDKSLYNKTKRLAGKVKKIAGSPRINVDRMYVFFKNNCPCMGKLYDDFRICDLKTGDVVYTITPSCGHDNIYGIAQVWGKENNFNGPLVSGTWHDVVEFFREPIKPEVAEDPMEGVPRS